jgi:transcriptional regulator with XRE-family HTH domain
MKYLYTKVPRPQTKLPSGNRFCDRLWWIMEINGDSALKVSRMVGVSCKTIYSYLSGKQDPKVSVLLAVADHYGVTTDFLLGRTLETHGYGTSPNNESSQ